MKKILLSLVAVLCSLCAMADGYSINFTSSQGDWTINNVTLPEGITYVWTQSTSYGMKASAYANSTYYATESWLVSPAITLTKSADASAITLSFSQAGKYFGNAATDVTVWVSEDAQNWTQLTMSSVLDGSSWTFVETTCDLTSYAGKTVYIGFKYTSSETAAATWEIKTVAITGIDYGGEVTPEVDITNTPETAYTVTEAINLIEAGEGLSAKVYVKGTVSPDNLSISTSYGNATYYITDGTNTLEVFRGYYLQNEKFTSEDQLQDGDEVIVYGQLTDYNGTKEFTSGNYLYSLNGKTQDDTPQEEYTCTGDGTLANPYTTEDITKGVYVAGETITGVWVKGVILGNVNTSTGSSIATGDAVNTNLALGNADGTNIIPIQLPTKPAYVRADLNIVDNPDNVGKTVYVYGDVIKYCGAGGIKNTSDYSWDGSTTAIQSVSATAKAQVIYSIAGQRLSTPAKGISIINGQKVYTK